MSRTIQTTVSNSASTSIEAVGTNTGFNAGELVYFQNGDYKGLSNLTLPSTATFPISQSQPVAPNSMSKSFNKMGAGTGVFGGSTSTCAAVLTNGNVVQVFFSATTGEPYFQVVDTSNTIQVSPTLVSAVYKNTSYPNIGVLALSGGGFVVYWLNMTGGTGNSMNYAVYTNTGSVTLAATQDTAFSLGISYGAISGVALPNGTFVLASIVNATRFPVFRGYSAAGVAAYGVTTIGTAMHSSTYFNLGLAARSDSSFAFFYITSATNYFYTLYSSAGANITSGNVTVASGQGQGDISTLSDGTTYVLVYENLISSKQTPCFRFLPTGNVLGAQNTVPVANINGGQMAQSAAAMSVRGLSNGNFIMTFGDKSNRAGLNYVVYNSSGVAVLATNSSGVIPLPLNSIPLFPYSLTTVLETSSGIWIHWAAIGRASGVCFNVEFVELSKTTYLPTATTLVSSTYGSVTAAASGVAYSNTAPTSISVTAASSTTVSVQGSMSYTLSPTALYTANVVCGVGSATLPNGNFLIAYRDSVTFAVYVSIFTPAGALIQTISVGTSVATAFSGGVGVAALSSGKFVVSYATTGSTITNALYSSSYTLISSVVQTNAYCEGTYPISVTGLSDDRYVIAYANGSSYSTYSVYDNTNTLVAGPTNLNTTPTNYGATVVATQWGFIFCNYQGTTQLFYNVYNTTGNTFATAASTSTTANSPIVNGRTLAYSNGVGYMLYWNSGLYAYFFNDSLNDVLATSQLSGVSAATYGTVAIGCTGFGNPVLFYPGATTPAYPVVSWTNRVPANWTTADITYPSSSFFSGTGMSFRGATGYGALPNVTSGVGNNAVLSWCDSNGYLYYAILNSAPSSTSGSLTAGVSASSAISVSPVLASVSSSGIGATMSGVAASSATAGSTGQVVVNGLAKLNSSYTNTASGAFDHSGTPSNGVKGTYSGSIVNMQGNT